MGAYFMKYGSIYDKDNSNGNYKYSSPDNKGFQATRRTSTNYHSQSKLNTDGLLRSSSGAGTRSTTTSSVKSSDKATTKHTSSRNYVDADFIKKQPSSGRSLSYHERKQKKKKKRGCFPFLLLVILLVIVAVFAFRFSLKGAFSKIKKYPLDKNSLTVTDVDANINNY